MAHTAITTPLGWDTGPSQSYPLASILLFPKGWSEPVYAPEWRGTMRVLLINKNFSYLQKSMLGRISTSVVLQIGSSLFSPSTNHNK